MRFRFEKPTIPVNDVLTTYYNDKARSKRTTFFDSELFIPFLTVITMMIIVLAIFLTVMVTVGDAVMVMNDPLPFSLYSENTGCLGNPISTGWITSVTAMGEGAFCENTIQKTENGDEIELYTKVVLTSCDPVPMGYVFLDAFTCTDSDCSDCTDAANLPVSANLMLPKFEPLPAVDTCWGVQAESTGITVFNQFDASAKKKSVQNYWKVFTDNSCLKDTITTSSASSLNTVLALFTTTATLMATALLW